MAGSRGPAPPVELDATRLGPLGCSADSRPRPAHVLLHWHWPWLPLRAFWVEVLRPVCSCPVLAAEVLPACPRLLGAGRLALWRCLLVGLALMLARASLW